MQGLTGNSFRVKPRRMHVEQLEDRRLLAVFTVTNLNDGQVSAPGDLPGSLRQAIYDANTTPGADEVVWTPGLTGTITLTAGELSITDDVSVTGLSRNGTVIDAAQNSRVIRTVAQTVSLSRLGVTGGLAIGGGGGGIFNSGDLTLNDVAVRANAGAVGVGTANGKGGGGILSLGGVLTIVDSVISDNRAGNNQVANSNGVRRGGDGGGILVEQGDLQIIDSTISGNRAGAGSDSYYPYCGPPYYGTLSGGGGAGGGIHMRGGGNAMIVGSTVSGNNAGGGSGDGNGGAGGGIFATVGSMTIENSVISGNNAGSGGSTCYFSGGDGGSGGGAYIDGDLTVTNSTVFNNVAGFRGFDYSRDGYGGGISANGDLTITGSRITSNHAGAARTYASLGQPCLSSGRGGGVLSSGGVATITNSMIDNNYAGDGGGGLAGFGNTEIFNTSISGNEGFQGGGLFGSGVATIENGRIAGNRTLACGGSFFQPSNSGAGGGISFSGDLEIIASSITGNATGNGATIAGNGGGISFSGNLEITASSITGNATGSAAYTYSPYHSGGPGGDGGGLSILGSNTQVTISETLISGNSTGSGSDARRSGRRYQPCGRPRSRHHQ